MLNFNDNRLDGYDLLDLINPIEKIIQSTSLKSSTHHWGDVNIDHQLCNEAVVTATRPQYQYTSMKYLALKHRAVQNGKFNPQNHFSNQIIS